MHDHRRRDCADHHHAEDDLLHRGADVEHRNVDDQQEHDDGREREDGRVTWTVVFTLPG
jgi:hypothetical protein